MGIEDFCLMTVVWSRHPRCNVYRHTSSSVYNRLVSQNFKIQKNVMCRLTGGYKSPI